MLPFLKPYCISVLYGGSIVDLIFDVGRIISIGICIIWLHKYKIYLDSMWKWVLLFELVLIIAAKDDFVSARFSVLINTLGAFVCVQTMLNRNTKKTIDTLFLLMTFLLLINLIVYFIFPMGLNNMYEEDQRMYFLGVPNVIAYSVLLTMLLCFIRNIDRKDVYAYGSLILCTITSLLFHSASGFMAFIIMFVSYLIYSKQIKWLTFKNVIILACIVEVIFVGGGQGIFESFIEIVLNKDITFTGRTYIWQEAIQVIADNPLLGVGRSTIAVEAWMGRDTYCHNAFLDIGIKAGVLGIIAFLLILLKIYHNIFKRKFFTTERIYSSALLGFLVIGLMEGLEDRIAFWIFLGLASVAHLIERRYRIEKI